MISVLGPGSVGLYLAAKLAQTGPVSLIARFPRAQATIHVTGTESITSQVAWLDRVASETRAVLVCVKAFDLPEALAGLADFSGPIYLCQNGLGLVEGAREVLPRADFRRALVVQGVQRIAPDAVRVVGGAGVQLGESEKNGELDQVFTRASVPVRYFEDHRLEWQKAVWNIPLNGICALTDQENGAALGDLNPSFELLMNECVQVARASGVEFLSQDLAQFREVIRQVGQNRNSLLQDLDSGRRTENEVLSGALVRRAGHLGIAVPGNLLVYRSLQALEKLEKD